MIHYQIITTKTSKNGKPTCIDNNIYDGEGNRITKNYYVFLYTEMFLKGKDILNLSTHLPVEHQGKKYLIQIIDSEEQS